MYTRPDVSYPEFRDDAGAVIPYGDRWGMDGPPDEAHSVTTHPERFEFTWTVARAVVDHLVATYDVEVQEDVDLHEGRDDPVRELELRAPAPGAPASVRRLVPRGPGASLTVIELAGPAIVLRAGVTFDQISPVCTCDACDESIDEVAERLEDFALAVALGCAGDAIEGRMLRQSMGPVGEDEHTWGTEGRLSWSKRRRLRRLLADAPAFAPWPLRRDG